MTTAQLQTFKADIAANANLSGQPGSIYQNTAVNAIPNNSDGNVAIAFWYNQTASPSFTLWRLRVPVGEVGKAQLSADVANLTTANLSRLQVIAAYSSGFLDGSVDQEAGFNDVYSAAGASGTRANLHIVWRRLALRIEKLFATGTGTDASPATVVVEGFVTGSDVQSARNTP